MLPYNPHRSLLNKLNPLRNDCFFSAQCFMVENVNSHVKNNSNNNWKLNLEATPLDKDIVSIFLLTDANNRRILLFQDAVWLVVSSLQVPPPTPPPILPFSATSLCIRAVAAKTLLFDETYSKCRLRLAPLVARGSSRASPDHVFSTREPCKQFAIASQSNLTHHCTRYSPPST